MKIAFLSRYQNQNHRGAESFVSELSKRLSKGHQVEILEREESDSVGAMLWGKYDVIIPMNGRLQGLKASLLRIKSHHKLIITGQSGIGRDEIFNLVVSQPDIFVALTELMESWAKKWAINTKVVKIPNGVDLEKFKPGRSDLKINLKPPIVLSVGALEWYKHHDLVIKAVNQLPGVSLLMVGQGSQHDQLLELGKKLLGERFQLSQFSYEQMPQVYRLANLFTLPSWSREAFGIVYLEAMATNLPVVAPNDSSRQEIINDGGLLTEVNNAQNYTRTLQEALNRSWNNKPRRQAEKFSWEKVAQKYDELLEKIKNG